MVQSCCSVKVSAVSHLLSRLQAPNESSCWSLGGFRGRYTSQLTSRYKYMCAFPLPSPADPLVIIVVLILQQF